MTSSISAFVNGSLYISICFKVYALSFISLIPLNVRVKLLELEIPANVAASLLRMYSLVPNVTSRSSKTVFL